MGTSSDFRARYQGRDIMIHASYDGHPDRVMGAIAQSAAIYGLTALRAAFAQAKLLSKEDIGALYDGEPEDASDGRGILYDNVRPAINAAIEAAEHRGHTALGVTPFLNGDELADFKHPYVGLGILFCPAFAVEPWGSEAEYIVDLDTGLFTNRYYEPDAPAVVLDLNKIEGRDPDRVGAAIEAIYAEVDGRDLGSGDEEGANSSRLQNALNAFQDSPIGAEPYVDQGLAAQAEARAAHAKWKEEHDVRVKNEAQIRDGLQANEPIAAAFTTYADNLKGRRMLEALLRRWSDTGLLPKDIDNVVTVGTGYGEADGTVRYVVILTERTAQAVAEDALLNGLSEPLVTWEFHTAVYEPGSSVQRSDRGMVGSASFGTDEQMITIGDLLPVEHFHREHLGTRAAYQAGVAQQPQNAKKDNTLLIQSLGALDETLLPLISDAALPWTSETVRPLLHEAVTQGLGVAERVEPGRAAAYYALIRREPWFAEVLKDPASRYLLKTVEPAESKGRTPKL